ncbi:MAG TPA: methyltransferase domain-containing protein [Dehalococcoidia bacterium]|nr:methyltransferase domain-containing protein [Dehalococcoidia bacterium]
MDDLLTRQGNKCKLDLEWDDRGVVPEVVYPDVEFLFRRMNEVTLKSVDAKAGEGILDVGCGRGIDGVEMAKCGAIVIGLEPSIVMIAHANNHIAANGQKLSLVRGVGEHLPFRAKSLDKVVCKGALDHFIDPAKVMSQMAAVLKAEGRAIIAVANFASLGFRLGRMVWWLRKKLGFKDTQRRMPWEVPSDHTCKFDYSFFLCLTNRYFQVEQVTGVSLFFGFPWWGLCLSKCPRGAALAVLNLLDKVASKLPMLSDIVVIKCKPKPEQS